MAIRVLRGHRVVHAAEYGMASLEHGVPITPETVFPIGSVSKQFTGLALAMLAEDGAIDLDEDVRAYVPEVPDFGHVITLRHLLHHTSGIRDWVRPVVFAGWNPSDVIDRRQVLELLRREETLNFAPGERHLYSNTGYVLLAEVVERVTKQPFPVWMRENVFGPLGMESTRVRGRFYDLVPHLAQSYYPIGEGWGPVPSGLTAYGSCCIAATVDDLVKWVRNLETGDVGGRAAVARMHTDLVEIHEWDGRLTAYGYGVQRFDYRGASGWFHSGQWVGYRAAILRVPSEDLAVVVVGNGGPSMDLREWDVLGIYVPLEEPAAPAAEPARADVAPGILDEYAGTYDLGLGETLAVTRAEDGIRGRFTGEEEASPLFALTDTEFLFHAGGDTLRFEPDGSALRWKGERAPRGVPWDAAPADLAEFAGTFYSPEIEATIRLTVEGDGLVGRSIRWGIPVPFSPYLRDAFTAPRADIGEALFVRDEEGDVRELRVSGRRALGVRFVKLEIGEAIPSPGSR